MKKFTLFLLVVIGLLTISNIFFFQEDQDNIKSLEDQNYKLEIINFEYLKKISAEDAALRKEFFDVVTNFDDTNQKYCENKITPVDYQIKKDEFDNRIKDINDRNKILEGKVQAWTDNVSKITPVMPK